MKSQIPIELLALGSLLGRERLWGSGVRGGLGRVARGLLGVALGLGRVARGLLGVAWGWEG